MNSTACVEASVDRRLRIALIEDELEVRHRLAKAIAATDRFELWFESGSVRGTQEWISSCSLSQWPDVWLVDIGLPDGSGLSVLKEVMLAQPTSLALVMSPITDDESIIAAIRSGAMGFVNKNASEDRLLEHLEQAADGGAPIPPKIASRLLDCFKRNMPSDAIVSAHGSSSLIAVDWRQANAGATLTSRERAVLDWLAHGYGYEEAAQRLQISLNTLRNHIRGIYTKLGVHSKVDAINEARKRRWLEPS